MNTYETYRRVRIADHCVAKAYRALQVGLVALVLIWSVYCRGHVEQDKNPYARISWLLGPHALPAVGTKAKYCLQPGSTTAPAAAAAAQVTMEVDAGGSVEGGTAAASTGAGRYPCVLVDWLQAVFVNKRYMFVTTFIEEQLQRRTPGCSLRSEACRQPQQLWETVDTSTMFVAQPEHFSIHMEHYVSAFTYDSSTESSFSSHAMHGTLSPAAAAAGPGDGGGEGSNVTKSKLDLPPSPHDNLKLMDLLSAAGVDLDEPVKGSTPRATGVGLRLVIHCTGAVVRNVF